MAAKYACHFLAASLMALLAVSSSAEAAGNAEAGRQLAELWCSSCHAVEPQPERAPVDGVPSFRAVAHMSDYASGWVRAFLNNPHPPMPNLSLTTRQIDDITAYLDRLHAS